MRVVWFAAMFCAGLLAFATSANSGAQEIATQAAHGSIQGTVLTISGAPVEDASVILQDGRGATPVTTKSDHDGTFAFSSVSAAAYKLRVEKPGFREAVCNRLDISPGQTERVRVTLATSDAPASSSSSVSIDTGMHFNDELNFTIAGITDGSESGGHGSDNSQRVSEALVRDTVALKSGANASPGRDAEHASESASAANVEQTLRSAVAAAPASFEANHRLGDFYFQSGQFREGIPFLASAYQIDPKDSANARELALAYTESHDFAKACDQLRSMLAASDSADSHRLLGEIEEEMHDPIAAVHDYERAAQLDPSEPNFFAWGSELLLHGAVQQAVDVFTKGANANPASMRMQAGIGAALYSAGKYGPGAERVCRASDLQPRNSAPYTILGRMEKGAPAPLPCAREKLAKFAEDHPRDALADYYYGVSLLKCYQQSGDTACAQNSQAWLEKAVALDPKFADGYLQLGVLHFMRGEDSAAIAVYQNAIKADPQMPDAHFRLALAYKKVGQADKARQEFAMYEQTKKAEAAEIERQRREIGQFVIVLNDKEQPR